ncbi:MAG: pantetheine-phosphate adenylyltransferase [Muribaculaceae bacterium]|nr:pantetheine-phosphate adenylyltransferase [Muribaculaceae bacterium]
MIKTTAFFPGSFNPFTTGHLDILSRALRVFDRVILGVGYNVNKIDPEVAKSGAMRAAENLRSLFDGIDRVGVTTYSDLTVEAARREEAGVIIRGFRNSIDAEYERQLAATNLLISDGGIDTWLIAARPEFECVSSSMVRELQHFNKDASQFLPTHQDCINTLKSNR